MPSRRATHAGSWYSSSGTQLDQQLSNWLMQAASSSHQPARAIISPHAGYSYCGSCAAYAYKQINPSLVKRIFILGPSHHFYLQQCALSQTTLYKTPLYDLEIDKKIYEELHATGQFATMSIRTDEDEHSIEMQLPYIAKAMESRQGNFTIVPVLVGSLNQQTEKDYGQIFSKYLQDPQNLFVISSDFCHWGERFRYQHYEPEYGEIYKSIEALDNKGMKIIERLAPEEFSIYLIKYRNTICGRHPIGVMLNAAKILQNGNGLRMEFRFLNYQQSSQCRSNQDSSVSYAAGSLVVHS